MARAVRRRARAADGQAAISVDMGGDDPAAAARVVHRRIGGTAGAAGGQATCTDVRVARVAACGAVGREPGAADSHTAIDARAALSQLVGRAGRAYPLASTGVIRIARLGAHAIRGWPRTTDGHAADVA